MPKTSKAKRAQSTAHSPLAQTIVDAENRSKFAQSKRATTNATSAGAADEADESWLDEKTSKRILSLTKQQQDEIDKELITKTNVGGAGRAMDNDDHENDADDASVDDGDESGDDDEDDYLHATTSDGYVTVNTGLSELEEEAVSKLMGNESTPRQTLADIIMAKINNKTDDMQDAGGADGEEVEEVSPFPDKVVEVYEDIGVILKRYSAGKLPKAFKVIPSLTEWEEILYLTRPDTWSPQAMYAATKIFASNLNPRMAQRFFNLVLLDAVRADIHENKKLNYHYYASLKKSLYKPAAFFKGILLPLCKQQCTLREAAVVSSVLAKVSVPVAHSAVAIAKICSYDYTPAQAIFLRTLLNKKYSLPVSVVRGVVAYFDRTSLLDPQQAKPVLWFQCLLTFVERYKISVSDDDKKKIKGVCQRCVHKSMTPAIRIELFGAQAFKGGESNS